MRQLVLERRQVVPKHALAQMRVMDIFDQER